jgi:hypothetical protein
MRGKYGAAIVLSVIFIVCGYVLVRFTGYPIYLSSVADRRGFERRLCAAWLPTGPRSNWNGGSPPPLEAGRIRSSAQRSDSTSRWIPGAAPGRFAWESRCRSRTDRPTSFALWSTAVIR